MKVICKEDTAKNLDLNEVTIISRNDVSFPVYKKKEYIVMGIVVYKDTNCVYYLVDDCNFPFWLPYGLFDISDPELSPNWFVKMFNKKEILGDLFYLSGFSEICNDDYHTALIEREEDALDIYFKRKAEVEKWYENKALLNWTKKQS